MTDTWFAETLYPDWRQSFRVSTELVRVTSPFQEIVVFDSPSHGRVMALDGAVQISRADEFVYQEMIAHVPILAHGHVRRALIIGAGDGGVLRRVLQHRGVERATMIEIDGEVIRVAKQFLPDIGGTAWDDPRAEIIVGDGIDFLKSAEAASVDVIIVDSTDPVGVGEALFSGRFYADCARVLGPSGVVVNQSGVPFMQPDELRETSLRRRAAFDHVSAYVVAVPTYVGGFMTLGIASQRADLFDVPAETLRDRAAASGMLSKTQYWTPEVHAASFHLPPYIARLLPR